MRSALMAGMVLGAVVSHRAGAADVLNVCIDQANPTAATDFRVATAVAKTQEWELHQVPFIGIDKGDDGFPPSRFAKMAETDCDLIMGFPIDVTNPHLPANVQATQAYASTGFVLVRRGGSKTMALSDFPEGSEVGIAQLDTYAGLLYGLHPNIAMHVYAREEDLLADLTARRIAAGVAWQPTIEAYEAGHPKFKALDLQAIPERHMVWNLVALYAPRAQGAAARFDQGLQSLQSTGGLKPLVTPYQQAALVKTQPTSARWAEPHLRPAMAWSGGDGYGNGGRFIMVSDTAKGALKSGAKVPALYTEEQATKGELAYYQNCSMCHGPKLDGQEGGYSGPALVGKDFADPSYDFHVSDIFNFVAKQMPAATPGSLPHDVDVQIMAFILKKNGYPAGAKKLVYEEAEKSRVPIRYHGK
jgi:polar amino acid transport system substrate-binding protein